MRATLPKLAAAIGVSHTLKVLRPHVACARLLPLLLIAFPLSVACADSDPPPVQVTLEASTPAISPGAAPSVTASPPEATAAPATVTSAACPDPERTPVASVIASSPTGDETPPPVPAIRIQHAAVVPSLPPRVTDSETPSPVPATLQTDTGLEALIRGRLGDDAEHYAVVIESLRDGRSVAIDAERVFYAASLFKLEVMYEVFHQREAGVLDFGEEFVASDYYSSFNLGPHLVGLCDRVSVGELLADMMSVSDNVAAVMLQDRAGAGTSTTRCRRWV